jgi:hypothetical protein
MPVDVQNETCETCHWPRVFGEDRIEGLGHFADDQVNTMTRTVLLIKIGCFRSHDGGHTSASGKTITHDRTACHNLLAADQTNPKILSDLGIVERQPAGVITQ